MSYDLAVWHGPRPADDEAAADEYERRAGFLDEDDTEPSPASPSMRAFLDDVLRRFPPLTVDADDDGDSPWATGPEPGDVDGDFAYLTMTFPGASAHLDEVVAIARRHGLVCFDPQTEALA